jgi:hypothetical protein
MALRWVELRRHIGIFQDSGNGRGAGLRVTLLLGSN